MTDTAAPSEPADELPQGEVAPPSSEPQPVDEAGSLIPVPDPSSSPPHAASTDPETVSVPPAVGSQRVVCPACGVHFAVAELTPAPELTDGGGLVDLQPPHVTVDGVTYFPETTKFDEVESVNRNDAQTLATHPA